MRNVHRRPGADSLEGFASPAVVTIVAMYILSAGVESAGVVDWLAGRLAALTGGDERRLLTAIVGTTGVSAGFVNNTPVVAVFIPLVTGLSERYGISPSNLLLPLSFAAMLGGTLTLVGTATNLLASDLSAQLLGRPFSMFTLTPSVSSSSLSALAPAVGRRARPRTGPSPRPTSLRSSRWTAIWRSYGFARRPHWSG